MLIATQTATTGHEAFLERFTSKFQTFLEKVLSVSAPVEFPFFVFRSEEQLAAGDLVDFLFKRA